MAKKQNRLFILEGADGTGKSTLAAALLEATKGHLLHGSWDKDWNISEYHTMMISSAKRLLEYQDVIIDRWAVSENVYANAFRGGSKYFDADDFMEFTLKALDVKNVTFIYCESENVIENHKNNSKIRKEMFEDMEPVVSEYQKYLETTRYKWNHYDFTKVDMNEFVKEITS